MVTLRRVVTKMKEFAVITNANTRLKSLESFINKVLEINQRKASQREVPLTYKEVLDIGKEFVENASEYVPPSARDGRVGVSGGGQGNFPRERKFNREGRDGRDGRDNRDNRDNRVEKTTKRMLEGHKFKGMDYCINFNLKDSNNQPKCNNKRCPRANNCGYIPRGEDKPCGKPHSKFEHFAKC